MRSGFKIFNYSIIWIAVLFIIFSSFLCCGFTSYAEDISTKEAFEKRNVLDDLNNSIIGNEEFDLDNYPYDLERSPQVIHFIEFGYTIRKSLKDDFGLYLYVYNPKGKSFSSGQAELKIGGSYHDSYPLELLNESQDNYASLFLKLKVNISKAKLGSILDSLIQSERVYDLLAVELAFSHDQSESYPVKMKFTYTGFAEGYGPEGMKESTLACKVDGLEKYLELDVHHTFYRSQGDYYDGKQTQLNSCYFRVPNEYFDTYGDLSKILCEWYEYITNPILVTEDDYLYRYLYDLHGDSVKNIGGVNSFLLSGATLVDDPILGNASITFDGYTSNIDLKTHYDIIKGLTPVIVDINPSSYFDNFSAVFLAEDGKSYKDRFVSARELNDQLLENSSILGDFEINSSYSQNLFTDAIQSGHTRGYNKKIVCKDDTFSLSWTTTTKSFWQTLFGGVTVDTEWDDVKALEVIDDASLKGNDDYISNTLFINKNDVSKLKDEFEKCGNTEKLVLFRFATSDYYSINCAHSVKANSTEKLDEELVYDMIIKAKEREFSSYYAWETVYLDFDIISLWFTLNGVETEIPVISSPQDVFSAVDPPLEENYHNESTKDKIKKIVMIILGLIILIVLVILFYPILTPIISALIKGLIWLVCLPFKAIGNAIKRKKKE